MKNLLNIEEQVKINMPGVAGDGVIAQVDSMQKWDDGVVHYIGKYHVDCPNGREGYNSSLQFTEDQCSKVNNKKK